MSRKRNWSSLIEGTPAYEAVFNGKQIKIGYFTLEYSAHDDEIILQYYNLLWFYTPKKNMPQKEKDILYGDEATVLKGAEKELRHYNSIIKQLQRK